MIFTRFGLKVISVDAYFPRDGMVTVTTEKGYSIDRYVSELKADGGINEIMDAIEKLNQ